MYARKETTDLHDLYANVGINPKGRHLSRRTQSTTQYEFYFSGHDYENEFSRLPELLDDADVYVPELFGWDKETMRVLEALSSGELSEDDEAYIEGTLLALHADFLLNSGKEVVIADTPLEYEKDEEIYEAYNLLNDPEDVFKCETFEEALEAYRGRIVNWAELGLQLREAYMARQLKNGAYNGKTLLIQLDAVHTNLFHVLRQEGAKVNRIFSEKPYVFSYRGEATRCVIFGKELKNEVVAKAFLEAMLEERLREQLSFETQNEFNRKTRWLLEDLSLQEIEQIFYRLRSIQQITEELITNHMID